MMDDMARTKSSEVQRVQKDTKPFASEALFRHLVYSANDAYFIFTVSHTHTISPFLEVNPTACKTTGYSRQQLLSMTFRDLVGNYISADELVELEKSIFQRSYTTMEWTHFDENGRSWPLELNIRVIPHQNEDIVFVIARDISERKEFENAMYRMAYFDEETGLPNQRKFRDELKTTMTTSFLTETSLAVVFINLDNFKQLVSTFGYLGAENVTKSAARRIKSCFPPNCVVARWGSDEFSVLIPAGDSRLQIELVNRMKTLFVQPFIVNGQQVFVTVSAGIAVHPTDGDEADTLIRNASTALIKAKVSGKSRMVRYSDTLHSLIVTKMRLVTDLRQALTNGEFLTFYQPEIEAATGRLVGVEALVRWYHPERGMIYPDTFIPAAEESGIISQIGEVVLHSVCRQLAVWESKGFCDHRVAINLSVLQLQTPDFVESVERILTYHNVHSDRIQFEITESVFMHIDEVADVLHGLHRLGITMAVDDFGTGFSSLSYLRKLPIDILKIDKSFIKNLPHSKQDWTIVKAIIELAHQLDLKVVAEGIETDLQQNTLMAMGCDFMQGFLFGKPVSQEEFTAQFID